MQTSALDSFCMRHWNVAMNLEEPTYFIKVKYIIGLIGPAPGRTY